MTTDTVCGRCGAIVAAGVSFCPLCGTEVSGTSRAMDATTPAEPTPRGAPLPPVESTASAPVAVPDPGPQRTQLDEQALEALRDATLGEYEILSELGRGGMATVYLAHEIALNRRVAIKLISPHLIVDNTAERFLREARTAAALSHPNLIPIFSVRETDSLLFFVMKYVAGPSLEVILKQGKRLSIPVIQAILSETASALGYAHRRQIVHRDVKPGNIMIDEDGRVVVTDFGIARDTQSTGLTGTGMAVGTPMYMSPEQCIGDPVSGASDQYSLGIVGYELLTGKVPFDAPNAIAMMYAHIHSTAVPLGEARADCPPQLVTAIMRMIEKTPANRWPSIDEANKALGAPPLTADDPVRQTLMDIAKEGAQARSLSIPSTPHSPMPGTRNFPRRPPSRPMYTPARGIGAQPVSGDAPTVRLTPQQLAAAAGENTGPTVASGSSRRPIAIALVGMAVVAAAVAGWFVFGRIPPAAPPPVVVNPPAAPPAAPPVIEPPAIVAKAPEPNATPRVASVAISPPVSQLRVGENLQLRALPRDDAGRTLAGRSARWTTSDKRIASVSNAGQLEGVAAGQALITTTVDGNSSSLTVTVAPAPPIVPTAIPVATVELSRTSLTVGPRETAQLNATLRDANGNVLTDRSVQWTSADAGVADVSNSGKVFGGTPGFTQVTATAEGHSATATITVPAPLAAAPPPPPPDPTPAIKKLIDSYAAAIHARNVARMISLYPSMSQSSRSTWDKLFEDYTDVTATVTPESVDIPGGGATAGFDIALTLVSGRERQRILMHFQSDVEQDNGNWRFKQIVQSFVKQ